MCPNGNTIFPKVRDYPPDDDGDVGYFLSLECARHTVIISRLSLAEIRELARQINLQVDEAERQQWKTEAGAAIAEALGDPQGFVEGMTPLGRTAAEVLADRAAFQEAMGVDDPLPNHAVTQRFVEGMTETSAIHPEIPDNLKPKRRASWDQFEQGYIPNQGTLAEVEYTRWKLAGGTVKTPTPAIPDHHDEEIPY